MTKASVMKDKTHKVVKDSKKKDWVKPELVVLGLRETESGPEDVGPENSNGFAEYSPSGGRPA